ncbi:MAG: hypothetical protein IT428_00120 [Planctomycetaceae bacterium]|nr:hypothetical protein [Planctomycetaceae bacterium]
MSTGTGRGDGAQLLSPRIQALVDEARNRRLTLEAIAHGYRSNVSRVESLQKLLDVLSVLIAIWFVAVLWGIQEAVPAARLETVKIAVNLVGTGLSLAVVSLVILSWRGEWRGITERHRQLADFAAKLAGRYRNIYEAVTFDEAKFRKVEEERQDFESQQNLPLGSMPPSCVPEGFRHVGKSYPQQNVRCHVCNRTWSELQLVPWWHTRVVFGKCENCGFVK